MASENDEALSIENLKFDEASRSRLGYPQPVLTVFKPPDPFPEFECRHRHPAMAIHSGEGNRQP